MLSQEKSGNPDLYDEELLSFSSSDEDVDDDDDEDSDDEPFLGSIL
jgi:hypothetical protein